MSITEKALDRFWRTMGERFGARWFDTYTDKPTRAWRDALSPFSPRVIAAAIELLAKRSEEKIAHPPTEPEFRALLQMATRHASSPQQDPNELRRGYWRSTIVSEVARSLGRTPESLEPIVIENRDTLGASMRFLLDECDDLELKTGQRTSGQDDHCLERAREIGAAFPHLHAKFSPPALPAPAQSDEWA